MGISIVHLRKEKMYHRLLSEVISREITNTNIAMSTVTSVKLSKDGSHIKVYLTFANSKERSMAELEKSKGFVRSCLARYANQRIVPQLKFVHDDIFENAQRIERIIKEINDKEK